MKFINQSVKICLQNFRKWQTDYRIWTVAALIFTLVWEQTHNLASLSQLMNIKSTLWYYPFLYSQYHMKLIFILPVLLIFCNAPFIDNNALFIIVRSKRKTWIGGQLLYIISASLVYNAFIFLCTLITSLPYSELSLEWGKILYTIADSSIAANAGYPFIDTSRFVLTWFSPLQAVWFTFLLSWLMCTMIGMLIYVLNSISNSKYIGVAVSSFLILFSCYIEVWGTRKMLWFSPVSWCTLDKLDVGNRTSNPTFGYCFFIYVLLISVISLILLLLNKHLTFDASHK